MSLWHRNGIRIKNLELLSASTNPPCPSEGLFVENEIWKIWSLSQGGAGGQQGKFLIQKCRDWEWCQLDLIRFVRLIKSRQVQ